MSEIYKEQDLKKQCFTTVRVEPMLNGENLQELLDKFQHLRAKSLQWAGWDFGCFRKFSRAYLDTSPLEEQKKGMMGEGCGVPMWVHQGWEKGIAYLIFEGENSEESVVRIEIIY